ncbi:lantibiotic dehydratase [Nonomuraea glycinis]|uniref:lantibiotic dehydratase n=1 Tax=Nonomuraea glycinis TaxID=2047744 RepID=UPI0033B5CD0A
MGEIGQGQVVLRPGSGAPPPRGEGYAAGAVFGVRVAGIPAERVAALRFSRTWSLVDEVVRLDGQVAAEGARLADILYELIGAGRRPELKPALVALRRDLFAGRRPRDRVWTPVIIEFLPRPVAGRMSRWLEDLDRLTGSRAEMSGLLDRELAEKTAVLRDATRLFEFRQGLAQSSSDLSRRLEAWLDAPGDAAPARQTLLRLAKYLARAAMKTSPYVTFTASGLGGWSAADGSAVFADDLPSLGVAEADRVLVHAFWQWSAGQPGLRDSVVLRVNPTAVEEDGRVWFLGHRPAEPINSVPASAFLRAVLDLIRSVPGTTRGAVAGKLTSLDDVERVDHLLGVLIASGLVEQRPPFSEQAGDALPRLIGWLERAASGTGGDEPRALEPLRAIADAVDAYARQPDGGKRRWREGVERIAERMAPDARPPGPELPSRHLVHESYVLAGTVVSWPSASLRRVHDDMNRVRRLLAVFDLSLPLKIALADYFLLAYGPDGSVPLLTFYRRVHDMGSLADSVTGVAVRRFLSQRPRRTGQAGDLAGYGSRMARLGELRRTAWDFLHAAQEKAGEGNPVPPESLEELMASWPSFIRPTASISVYGQLMTTPEGPRLVVNYVGAGPRRGVGRIQHLLATAGDRVPDLADRKPVCEDTTLADRKPVCGDTTLAEFRVDHGNNLDIHPRALPVIDYPRAGGDDAEETISPTGLRVEYDPDHELLVLRGPDGRAIRPAHLGLTFEVFLPPAQSFLIRAFGPNPTVMMAGWALRGGMKPPPSRAVEHAPRLTIGAVVLMRARWRMRAGEFPAPGKGEDPGAYLLRLALWLDGHGIPREFFARVLKVNDSGGDGVLGKSRKPVYVDVTNWFLIQDFVRVLDDPDRLMVLEEAVPAMPDLPRYGEHGSRVTEYIFDLAAMESTAESTAEPTADPDPDTEASVADGGERDRA